MLHKLGQNEIDEYSRFIIITKKSAKSLCVWFRPKVMYIQTPVYKIFIIYNRKNKKNNLYEEVICICKFITLLHQRLVTAGVTFLEAA